MKHVSSTTIFRGKGRLNLLTRYLRHYWPS
jgi:hypothetical protein